MKYETQREPELDLIHRRIELGIRSGAVDRTPPPQEMEFVHYPTYMKWKMSKLEGLSSSSRHAHSLHSDTKRCKIVAIGAQSKAKQTGACFNWAWVLKLFHWCYIGAIISLRTRICVLLSTYQGRQKCLRISPLSWIKRMLGYGTNWPTADEMYPAVSYLQQGHWLDLHWLTSSSLISWSSRNIYLWTLSKTELVLIHSVKLWREETFSKITNNDSHRS